MVPHQHSPLEIKIALHYYAHPYDYENGEGNHWDAPATRAAIKALLEHKLLSIRPMSSDEGWVYTRGPALNVYVEALCAVPWPVQTWVIPKDADG